MLQLPAGATLDRTEAVVKQATDIILKTRGIEHAAPFAGLDATTFTVASNAGTIFSGLPSLYNHSLPGVTATTVLATICAAASRSSRAPSCSPFRRRRSPASAAPAASR